VGPNEQGIKARPLDGPLTGSSSGQRRPQTCLLEMALESMVGGAPDASPQNSY
jgi:hypothetical protein